MAVKDETCKRHLTIMISYALGIIPVLLSTGCTKPRGELFPAREVPLVWPKPPERPRIRYVGMLSTEADLKKEASWSESLGEILFGKEKLGVLVGPYAVAVDENDRLYATDASGGAVHVFDLSTRNYKQFSSFAESKKLLKPVGLAICDNAVYVVDSALHEVCVFSKDGKFMFSFGGERLSRPSGIAYWKAGERIYVADTARHVIDVFGKDGKLVKQVGGRGLSPGRFNFPTHLWVDEYGTLYVSDTLNYRIQVFTSEGKFLRMFGQQGDRPGNFAHPCGIATDSFGHIYVSDRQFENIQVFDSEGKILMAFGQEGSEPGDFWLPAGICVDSHNRIYVADSFNKRIQIFELLEENKR